MRVDKLRCQAVHFGRQSRLPEIGDHGQARLCEARIALGGEGWVRTIEERYVRGIGAIVDDSGRTFAVDANALGIESPAAREVAEGALRALVALRSILEDTGKSGS
jgi:hypothetical protein